MEKESFDYSKVPHNFGLCAAADCPHADTCLRRIAYTHTPASVTFPPTLNPKTIEAMAGKCEYYRSNQKVRYAKGFVHGSIGCQCVRNIPLRANWQLGNQTILSETERRNFTLACRTTKSDGTGQEVGLTTGRVFR